ncbi:MAG: GNAT family protein [Candidatus Cloacimonetes bacterium]|nr:GNAT family protein [Candidatus Cloacimonadota bacterium]
MKYFRKLAGKNVYLSPVSMEDSERYTEWLNDIEVLKYLEIISRNMDLAQEKVALAELIKNNTVFAIINRETEQLIGNVGFHNVDHLHQIAEIGIFIGNKNFWNRGFGTEAMNLALDYGFNILNLHNIMLRTFSYNNRAISCYKKIGFQESGRLREAYQIAGTRYDIILMDLLATEYESVMIEKIVSSDEHERSYGARIEIVD